MILMVFLISCAARLAWSSGGLGLPASAVTDPPVSAARAACRSRGFGGCDQCHRLLLTFFGRVQFWQRPTNIWRETTSPARGAKRPRSADREIDEIIEKKAAVGVELKECRAKARSCEERANETSDFIMKKFWLSLAREWHELANRVEDGIG